MSEHSAPQAPTVDEIAGRLREALVAIRDHGETHDQPCHALHRGDCADAMQEIARAALAAVNNDPAAAPVPVSSDQSSLPGPDAPRWTRAEIVDLIHDGLPLIKAYDTTIEAPRRFAEEIAASLLARDVDAAVNSDQADTAVSTDRGESANSAVPQVTDGLVDELLQLGARYGRRLRDDMPHSRETIHEQAAVKVRDVLVRYAGQGPALTSEFRAVIPRWDGSGSSRGTWPRLDYALREARRQTRPDGSRSVRQRRGETWRGGVRPRSRTPRRPRETTMPRRTEPAKVVETLAGIRCPCGHLDDRHRRPDPNWRVGQLVEIRGACRDCGCRGEIADAEPSGETER